LQFIDKQLRLILLVTAKGGMLFYGHFKDKVM